MTSSCCGISLKKNYRPSSNSVINSTTVSNSLLNFLIAPSTFLMSLSRTRMARSQLTCTQNQLISTCTYFPAAVTPATVWMASQTLRRCAFAVSAPMTQRLRVGQNNFLIISPNVATRNQRLKKLSKKHLRPIAMTHSDIRRKRTQTHAHPSLSPTTLTCHQWPK